MNSEWSMEKQKKSVSCTYDTCLAITQRFDGDGEFRCPDNLDFERKIGLDNNFIAFFSKPFLTQNLIGEIFSTAHISMFSKNGLLSEANLQELQSLAGTRSVIYMGDLDPPDLLNFAVLDAVFGKKLLFGPYCSEFCSAVDATTLSQMTMSMTANEQTALPLVLNVLDGKERSFGNYLYFQIMQRRKLEIDAMLMALQHFQNWLLARVHDNGRSTPESD